MMLDDSDENFLLADEEARSKKPVGRGEIIWSSSRKSSKWGQKVDLNAGDGQALSTTVDEHHDHLEDSPLLINDAYREYGETDFHCHDYLGTTEDVNAWKKLSIAALLCFIFMVTELIGGYLAGSLAVMTDAAHLFSDFVGFLISLLAIWVGKKPATKSMTFGYYRAEVIGALLSVLTIWLLAAIFSTLAINRLYSGDYEIDAKTMIVISSLGLAVNIIMGGVLHGVCHSHAPSSSDARHSNNNINVRAAAIHVLGDFLQSAGVLSAALIIVFFPEAKMADPICTLVFSLIVICTTVRVGRDSLWHLMEGAPSPADARALRAEMKALSAVRHVHGLHFWSLAPGKNAVSVHLAVDQCCDRDLLLKRVTALIRSRICVVSCTVQIEGYNLDLISSCQHCQNVQC